MTTPLRSIRLTPKSDYTRFTGNRGEIFYDPVNNTLRVFNSEIQGGAILATRSWVQANTSDFTVKNLRSENEINIEINLSDSTLQRWTFGEDGVLTFPDGTNQPTAWTGSVAYSSIVGIPTLATVANSGSYNDLINKPDIAGTYQFSVAADDSTQRTVSTDEVIKFTGAGGITTSSDAEGNIIITGAGSTGNITFAGNVIDSIDSSAITFTPSVVFDSDITVGTDIVFPDGSRQSTSAVGIPGPKGDQGEPGATGAGTGDVISAGGSYVDNRIVRYDGTTGTIIQVSSASISDAGLLTATSFSGDGTLITALNATELTSGTIPDARFPSTLPARSGVNLTALNATQLTSGTIPDARFPETLPAASGVNLTALNATQLTSGTVPVARLGASGTRDATTYLRGDNTWATVAGGGGTASDSFSTIAVAGQSSVVADSATDTLTLVAGDGITITTDAATDTVTITGTAGGAASDSFATIAVTGQSSLTADSATDTLTFVAGTGISITTNAGTDAVTINSTVTSGVTTFSALTDNAGLTVDKFYLPAITRLDVTANGTVAYRFDQYGTTDNPTVYALNATTIAFNLNVGGHPFLIRTSGGSNFNSGLTHVSTTGVVLTGAAAQGQTTGTLYWKIPSNISLNYQYICGNHAAMVGIIAIKDFAAI
jgi:hypothetical protein